MKTDATPHATMSDLRDQLGMARAILEYALRENIAAFSLSGLKIPRVLQTWSPGAPLPTAEEFATEVAIFEEHLGDRVAAISYNRKMLQEIWRFNELTREFREKELRNPAAARDVLDQLTELINALFAQDLESALEAFEQCHTRRINLLNEMTLMEPQLETATA